MTTNDTPALDDELPRRSNLLPAIIIAGAALAGGRLATMGGSSQAAAPPASNTVTTTAVANAADVESPASAPTTSEFFGPTPTEVPRPSWDYSLERGPARWADLGFTDCAQSDQAPMRIETATAQPARLPTDYGWALGDTEGTIVNDGARLSVELQPGSGVRIDGVRHDLVAIEIHTPAEHVIDDDGAAAELTAYFVSADADLASLAVLVQPGDDNPKLDPLIEGIPSTAGFTHPTIGPLELGKLFAVRGPAVSYDGSATTPPCQGAVHTVVLTEPVTASAAQLSAITETVDSTNRPLQPAGDRTLTLIASR
jgi:carbonic anhydrase